MSRIKEFLKPNKWKIIITVLLMFFGLFGMGTLLALNDGPPIIRGIFAIPIFILLIPFAIIYLPLLNIFSPAVIFGPETSYLFDRAMMISLIASLIVSIFYWYVLSCLIYRVGIKIKHRKAQKNSPN